MAATMLTAMKIQAFMGVEHEAQDQAEHDHGGRDQEAEQGCYR
jgi:hypothetical protein